MLLGMGGSSFVSGSAFGSSSAAIKGFPPSLHVLDSTVSGAGAFAAEASKLGQDALHRVEQIGLDVEPEHLQAIFLRSGRPRSGSRFIAITDPGSKMEQVAREEKFLYIFTDFHPSEGRYSALSDFGMIPPLQWGSMRRSSWNRLRKWWKPAHRGRRERTP